MAARPVKFAPLINPFTAGIKVLPMPAVVGEIVSFGVPPPWPIAQVTDAVVVPVGVAVRLAAPRELVA